MTRSFPCRSPSGPNTSCSSPYTMANTVTVFEAEARPTPYSPERRTSRASITRIEAALAKAASDRRTMVLFGESGGGMGRAGCFRQP